MVQSSTPKQHGFIIRKEDGTQIVARARSLGENTIFCSRRTLALRDALWLAKEEVLRMLVWRAIRNSWLMQSKGHSLYFGDWGISLKISSGWLSLSLWFFGSIFTKKQISWWMLLLAQGFILIVFMFGIGHSLCGQKYLLFLLYQNWLWSQSLSLMSFLYIYIYN